MTATVTELGRIGQELWRQCCKLSAQKNHECFQDDFQLKVYVVHQQDRLLSCQLRPAFPTAWKECGAVRLQTGIVH